MNHHSKKSLCVLLVLLSSFISQHGAFDTGHHWDITFTALSLFGFSEHTIRYVKRSERLSDGGEDGREKNLTAWRL
jgi:hypothetical protein